MKLPHKINVIRMASVFNQDIKESILKNLNSYKKYIDEILKKDLKENVIFRNYQDYLVSIVLEKEGAINHRFTPLTNNILSSKEYLKKFIEELNMLDNESRLKSVGVFDTETTGLKGYIVSYAFVIEELETLNTKEHYELINPKSNIEKEALAVHKISEEDIKDKPTFIDRKDYILELFNQVDMIVGHNVLFDLSIMKRELERANHFPNIIQKPIFDTMYFSADIINTADRKKMPKLEEAIRFFGISDNVTFHNALDDVKVTLELFNTLLNQKL